MHRFENRPHCFHLEWLSGGSPPDDIAYWIVRCATGCELPTRLSGKRPSAVDNVPFMECRCYLSGGNGSRGLAHIAYQEACLKLVKGYVSLFGELSQSGAADKYTIDELRCIFHNLTQSSLLEHCCLDMELISLCRSFFGFANDCLTMRPTPGDAQIGKENMLKWFLVSRFSGQWDRIPICT